MQHNYRLLLFFFLLVPFMAKAQLQFGVRADNHSGILSAGLNPALTAFHPYRWDANLSGIAHFSQNNYAYLAQTGLLDLLRAGNNLDLDFGPDVRQDNLNPEGIVLDFFDDNQERYFASTTTIALPSLLYKINDQHTVGLIAQSRVALGGDNISDNFSYYTFNTRASYDTFPVPPVYGGLLAWTELGLHYSFRKNLPSGMISLGITAKYLMGQEGGYFYTDRRHRMARLPLKGLGGTPVGIRFAYTNSLFTEDSYQAAINGTGLGLDLGLSYIITNGADAYSWKLGVALLDLGAIQFDQSAFNHTIDLQQPGTLDGRSFDFFQDLSDTEAIIDTFSSQLLGFAGASLTGNSFTQVLPAKLSFQLDHRINDHFYVGALFVQPLRLSDASVPEGSLIVAAPRYESRWIGVAMPVQMYRGKSVQLGIALRLGPLYMGTENLGSFGVQDQFSGTDFYAGLRLGPWLYRKASRGAAKNPACPSF